MPNFKFESKIQHRHVHEQQTYVCDFVALATWKTDCPHQPFSLKPKKQHTVQAATSAGEGQGPSQVFVF